MKLKGQNVIKPKRVKRMKIQLNFHISKMNRIRMRRNRVLSCKIVGKKAGSGKREQMQHCNQWCVRN